MTRRDIDPKISTILSLISCKKFTSIEKGMDGSIQRLLWYMG